MRIQCPFCETSYTTARCGLDELTGEQRAHATVVCKICVGEFDLVILPGESTAEDYTPNWFMRVIMRRKPRVVVTWQHTVETFPRKAA